MSAVAKWTQEEVQSRVEGIVRAIPTDAKDHLLTAFFVNAMLCDKLGPLGGIHTPRRRADGVR